jgi:excisionase family DNA binding protein
MPRHRKYPAMKFALSPAAWADALDIRDDEVAEAIASGHLPVFSIGIKRRILASDVERWVRSWPQATKRKPR